MLDKLGLLPRSADKFRQEPHLVKPGLLLAYKSWQ